MRKTEEQDRIIQTILTDQPTQLDSKTTDYPDDDDFVSYAALLDRHAKRRTRPAAV